MVVRLACILLSITLTGYGQVVTSRSFSRSEVVKLFDKKLGDDKDVNIDATFANEMFPGIRGPLWRIENDTGTVVSEVDFREDASKYAFGDLIYQKIELNRGDYVVYSINTSTNRTYVVGGLLTFTEMRNGYTVNLADNNGGSRSLTPMEAELKRRGRASESWEAMHLPDSGGEFLGGKAKAHYTLKDENGKLSIAGQGWALDYATVSSGGAIRGGLEMYLFHEGDVITVTSDNIQFTCRNQPINRSDIFNLRNRVYTVMEGGCGLREMGGLEYALRGDGQFWEGARMAVDYGAATLWRHSWRETTTTEKLIGVALGGVMVVPVALLIRWWRRQRRQMARSSVPKNHPEP